MTHIGVNILSVKIELDKTTVQAVYPLYLTDLFFLFNFTKTLKLFQ